MELPLISLPASELKPGMRLQLVPGNPESAVIARIDGYQVYFADGESMAIESRNATIFNPHYVPSTKPPNPNIPINLGSNPPRPPNKMPKYKDYFPDG